MSLLSMPVTDGQEGSYSEEGYNDLEFFAKIVFLFR